MAKISGKGGTFLINSVQFHVGSWTFDAEADMPDATDSATAAGKKSVVVGRAGATITLEGKVDAAAPPGATISVGSTLSTIHLTINGTAKYIVPTGYVRKLSVSTNIASGDAVSFTAEIVVDGTWTEMV